jgi:hypothetical protein
MADKKTEALPTIESIAFYVKKNFPKAKMPAMRASTQTVREDEYRGHHIVVRTTYRIEVDDRPVTGLIHVSNNGQVGYHGLPNMSFDSAIDLVKKLIDRFPQDFVPGQAGPEGGMSGGMDMSGSMDMTGMAGMPGMEPKRHTSASESDVEPKKEN